MKAQNIESDAATKLNDARLSLGNIERLLTSDDVASIHTESLYYDFMSEIRNLVVGIGVFADIANRKKGIE